MKMSQIGLMLLIVFAIGRDQLSVVGQTTTTSRGISIVEVKEPLQSLFESTKGNPSPVVGASYTIVPGWGVESGADGSTQAFFAGMFPDPVTGVINDAVMDDQATVIGVDAADVFGAVAPNNVIVYECLESNGMDVSTGRYELVLTLTVGVTGTALQWDTLDQDLQDPFDIGFDSDGDGTITLAEGAGDGVLGKGPDGVFGTADDVVVQDGIGDTGDGVLDATFPMDPVGLTLPLDLDGDGDPTNDPPSPAVNIGLFLGESAAGTSVQFDLEAGSVNVTSAIWSLLDSDGNEADIDNDGIADGPFDLSGFSAFACDPTSCVWLGNLGVGFGADEVMCTTQEQFGGNIRSQQLTVTYLSSIEPELFCFDGFCEFAPGDIDGDGAVGLLDIGPFVDALVAGEFLCQGDFSGDGVLNLLDIAGLVDAILGG